MKSKSGKQGSVWSNHFNGTLAKIEFPMPPSVNRLYGLNRYTGTVYKKKHPFFSEMGTFALPVKAALSDVKLSGPLHVDRYFCFNRKSVFAKAGHQKRLDVSNRIKAFDDELAKLLLVDDQIFWKGTEELCITEDQECVIVQISQHGPRTKSEVLSVLAANLAK